MKSILIGLFTTVFIWTTYYLGGGTFIRGESLGKVFAVSIIAGIVASVAAVTYPFEA